MHCHCHRQKSVGVKSKITHRAPTTMDNDSKGLDIGSVILIAAVAILVGVIAKAEMSKSDDGATIQAPSPLMSGSGAASYALQYSPQRERYFGQSPPASGYGNVRSTYSGEWEASADAPYETGPGIMQNRLSVLKSFSNVKSGGSALASPMNLRGPAGGVAYLDGVDIPMPILREESRANTGFHGKSFEDSPSLLTGVV